MGVMNECRGKNVPTASKTNLEQFIMPCSRKELVYGVTKRVNIHFKDYFCEKFLWFYGHREEIMGVTTPKTPNNK